MANAGEDQSVLEGTDTIIQVGTSLSGDEEDTPVFSWKQLSPASPQANLSNASSASPTFPVPSVAAGTDFVFELTVTDSEGSSSSDRVVVHVLASLAGDGGVRFDQSVSPAVIFSDGGVANGFWAVDRRNGVEVGLRGKARGANLFNSLEDGRYYFEPGPAAGTPGGAVPALARWNYEWHVNVDTDDDGTPRVGQLRYFLGLDIDPRDGRGNVSFYLGGGDHINLDENLLALSGAPSYAFGNGSTGAGEGQLANGDVGLYRRLVAGSTVAQDSSNLGFTATALLEAVSLSSNFSTNSTGSYFFLLRAEDTEGSTLAEVEIEILVDTGAFVLFALVVRLAVLT